MLHSILVKTIEISSMQMDHPLIKIPSFSQKHMAYIHRHNITYNFIFISCYLRINFTFFTYQDLMSFVQPGYLVGNWMFTLIQVQLLHHIYGNYIFSAPTVNHHLAAFSFDLAHSPEQEFPLSRFCTFLLRFRQDFVYHQSLSSLE